MRARCSAGRSSRTRGERALFDDAGDVTRRAETRRAETPTAQAPAPGGEYDYLRHARELQRNGDIDGSGTIDILDAYELARSLRTGRPGLKHWDFNSDGRVDHADVDVIARRAVAITRGGA